MNSFVGLVTRKNVQTGVTLKAKIVTPSGKVYSEQDFKVMVKPLGMSDLNACIIDLNTTMTMLTEKGITSVTQNITSAMPNVGDNGTKIGYAYENSGSEKITDYIGVDGVIKKRPKYGEQAVAGKLVIAVSKGKESVNSKMDIVIAPYSIEEIFTAELAYLTWDKIRGKNAVESADSASGLRNVMYDLNLIKTIPSSAIVGSAVDATIEWSVSDTLQTFAEAQSLYTGTRINKDTGALIRPNYTTTYNVYQSVGETYGMSVVAGSVPMIRIGGVVLTATIKIEGSDITKTKTFVLSTLSKYLTNSEVAQWLFTNVKATLDDGTTYLQMGTGSSVIAIVETEEKPIRSITIPKSATGFGAGTSIGLQKVNADVVTTINDFENPDNIKTYATAITTGPISNEDLGVSTITLDLSKARNLPAVDKKFIVKGNINVWAYSADGVMLGGEPSVSKAIWKFEMTTLGQ